MTELTFALTKYNDEMMAELERLRKSDSSKQEAVAELTWNLMSHREEREKTVKQTEGQGGFSYFAAHFLIELSDFNFGDLDLLEDCPKNKWLKTIDVKDLDCFDDILN